MLVSRRPGPALRPFVRLLWAAAPGGPAGNWREHILPTGCMHLAMRLSGPPLRLYADEADRHGRTVGHAVVGGARGGFYLREASGDSGSIGALLEPGAAHALFGAGADALAESHTPLADLWGHGAELCLERLHHAPSPSACLAVLEDELLARLRGAAGLDPALVAALCALRSGGRVRDAVRASGFSHRHLLVRFRETVGLAPKRYARVLRLQDALAALARPHARLVEVGLQAGYADQAHFTRDFHAFAGLTPTRWLAARPVHPNHVPVGPAP
jgi:AraC-like DNA-binding protein